MGAYASNFQGQSAVWWAHHLNTIKKSSKLQFHWLIECLVAHFDIEAHRHWPTVHHVSRFPPCIHVSSHPSPLVLHTWGLTWNINHFGRLMQERRNSIANTLELHFSCISLLICKHLPAAWCWEPTIRQHFMKYYHCQLYESPSALKSDWNSLKHRIITGIFTKTHTELLTIQSIILFQSFKGCEHIAFNLMVVKIQTSESIWDYGACKLSVHNAKHAFNNRNLQYIYCMHITVLVVNYGISNTIALEIPQLCWRYHNLPLSIQYLLHLQLSTFGVQVIRFLNVWVETSLMRLMGPYHMCAHHGFVTLCLSLILDTSSPFY